MRSFFYLIFFIFFALSAQAAQIYNPSVPTSTPDSQLTDNGDGTISDTATGLMWKKCLEGLSGNGCTTGSTAGFTWQQALEQPGAINSAVGFAGFHDWRLPNIRELISIVEEQCWAPAINLNRFPNTSSSSVWSGTPNAYNSSEAWFVTFYYGGSYSYVRGSTYQVRLVRSGQ